MQAGNSVEEQPSTPTELGVSAQKMNKALVEAGLQNKVDDEWVPTAKAEGY